MNMATVTRNIPQKYDINAVLGIIAANGINAYTLAGRTITITADASTLQSIKTQVLALPTVPDIDV